MRNGISSVERAFQLARTGNFRTMQRLKSALSGEGYNAYEIQGPILTGQLTRIMRLVQKLGTGWG